MRNEDNETVNVAANVVTHFDSTMPIPKIAAQATAGALVDCVKELCEHIVEKSPRSPIGEKMKFTIEVQFKEHTADDRQNASPEDNAWNALMALLQQFA